MSNVKKAEALGMPFGTASNKLRKNLLFTLATKLGLTNCHRCGERIVNTIDFSIEHKEPWLSAEDPIGAFFDLDNVAFSHIKCNVGAARREQMRCPQGHEYTDENTRICKDGSRQCRQCSRDWDREYWHTSGKARKRKQRRNSQ